jgi:hypothetical protein
MRFNYYKKKMYDYKYNNSSSLLKEIEKIRKSEGISKKKLNHFGLLNKKNDLETTITSTEILGI